MILSIIIPIYNAANHLGPLLDELVDFNDHLGCFESLEVLLVNDGSTDATRSIIDAWSHHYPFIHVIHLPHNQGQQRATYMGMRQASGHVVATLDDDLKHKPSHVLALHEKLQTDLDLVFGVIDEGQRSPYRQWCSEGISRIIARIFPTLKGLRVTSFRVFSKALNQKAIQSDAAFIYVSCELLKHAKKVHNSHLAPYRTGHVTRYTLGSLLKVTAQLIYYYHPLRGNKQ